MNQNGAQNQSKIVNKSISEPIPRIFEFSTNFLLNFWLAKPRKWCSRLGAVHIFTCQCFWSWRSSGNQKSSKIWTKIDQHGIPKAIKNSTLKRDGFLPNFDLVLEPFGKHLGSKTALKWHPDPPRTRQEVTKTPQEPEKVVQEGPQGVILACFVFFKKMALILTKKVLSLKGRVHFRLGSSDREMEPKWSQKSINFVKKSVSTLIPPNTEFVT